MPIQGANNPASADGNVGSIPYGAADSGRIQDDVYAVCTSIDVSSDGGIEFTNFGFTIPTDGTITDIQVELRHDTTGIISESISIFLIPHASSKSLSVPASMGWGLVNGTPASYGNTFSPAQINASTFGVYVKWIPAESGISHRIDACRITITYTQPDKEIHYVTVNLKSYASLILRRGIGGM